MTNINQSHEFLTSTQIASLTTAVIEIHGANLSEVDLIDSISLMLESIPGIEIESPHSIQCSINQIRCKYHE